MATRGWNPRGGKGMSSAQVEAKSPDARNGKKCRVRTDRNAEYVETERNAEYVRIEMQMQSTYG